MNHHKMLVLSLATDTSDIDFYNEGREKKKLNRGGSFRKVGKNLGQITNHKSIIRSVHANETLQPRDFTAEFRQRKGKVEESKKRTDPVNVLKTAASRGNPGEILGVMLKHPHVNIDAEDDKGRTALHLAAQAGRQTCLEMLINCGANVNVLDSYCLPALYYAVMAGHYDLASILIDAGADVNTIQNGFLDVGAYRKTKQGQGSIGVNLVSRTKEHGSFSKKGVRSALGGVSEKRGLFSRGIFSTLTNARS